MFPRPRRHVTTDVRARRLLAWHSFGERAVVRQRFQRIQQNHADSSWQTGKGIQWKKKISTSKSINVNFFCVVCEMEHQHAREEYVATRQARYHPTARSFAKGPACGKFCTIYQDCNLILQSAKILKYRQNTKIRFSIWKSKMSAVPTPNLTAKAAFFRIFRDLAEKMRKMRQMNISKTAKILRTKFWKFSKNRGFWGYFDILVLSKCILSFDSLFVFRICNLKFEV